MFVKRNKESNEFEAGDLTILKELVNPMNDNVSIGYSLAQARLPIGKSSLPHRLKGSELYYILEGKGRLHSDQDSLELSKGDSALVPPNSQQFIENIGQGELHFLCIVEPFWTPDSETTE